MSSIFTCQNCGSSSYEQFSQTQVRCMNCKNISEFDTGYKVPKQFEIINDSNVLDLVEKASFKRASIIKRMFNTLIDTMIIMAIFSLFGNLEDLKNALIAKSSNNNALSIFATIFVLYYPIFEYFFGKTVGKFITKTKVISNDGNKVSLLQCIGRVFSRFLPFEYLSFIINGIFRSDSKQYSISEYFSYLFNESVFWHDSLPNTLVVED